MARQYNLDDYRGRYDLLLKHLGMDSGNDAHVMATIQTMNGLSDSEFSDINNWIVTSGMQGGLPDDFSGRLQGHLAGGGIDAARARRSSDQQNLAQGSGGLTTGLDVVGAAADLAGSTLPLTRTPPAAQIPDPWAAAAGTPAPGGFGSVNPDAPAARTPLPGRGPEVLIDIPNVSDGGPGTSSAKGQGNIDRQTAKRTAPGFVSAADSALGSLDLGIGEAARAGLVRAGKAAKDAGMPNLGRGLVRFGRVARFAAPALAVGGAVLPAVTGAMEGYEQAGVGGAAIHGASGLGGAAVGAAIGSALLPGVGTVIGAGLGSMAGSGLGSGLTSVATGLVEKGQAGDTGWIGGIGRALDPFIDTAFEKEQKAALQQMNSPAMREIALQQQTRQMAAANQQRQQVLMQAALQGLL